MSPFDILISQYTVLVYGARPTFTYPRVQYYLLLFGFLLSRDLHGEDATKS